MEKFVVSTINLKDRIADYCDQLEAKDEAVVDPTSALEGVKAAWVESMLQYHQLSSISFGPEENGVVPVRELLYS